MKFMLFLSAAVLSAFTAFIVEQFAKAKPTGKERPPSFLDWLIFTAIVILPPALATACVVIALRL